MEAHKKDNLYHDLKSVLQTST